jgi:DNA-binding transcriptional regulator LsrR (DeoR family)
MDSADGGSAVDRQRLVTKVARLYHTHGLRQTEIAERLQISQSRVSRLLSQAEDAGIVRTVVAVPRHINADLEDQIEQRYGLREAHVIDVVGDDESEINRDLGYALAPILNDARIEAPTVGFTSWSQTLRLMVQVLEPLGSGTERVVEMVGDLGPPDLQHEAARSTQMLAALTGAQPVFLRTPGVVPSPEVKDLLLRQDLHARAALEALDSLDLALLGVGTCEIVPPLRSGDNFFTQKQLDEVARSGAVGEFCLRFFDEDGDLVSSPLDDVVVAVTPLQLRKALRRWAVGGGRRKHVAIRALLRGGWVDTLVTDTQTATFLLDSP